MALLSSNTIPSFNSFYEHYSSANIRTLGHWENCMVCKAMMKFPSKLDKRTESCDKLNIVLPYIIFAPRN